ncbi:MAG: peptidase C25 [Thermonema sp.]|uniref:type IX secretion system sortase PorU n=1 Tax=Thermonema sp. TaxID=2231181 RepID=UPI0021DE47BD|nr:type IX secretion system sortase PorU [Thermonema sp.]GIV38421.1 MAG: peptidase C25 [Thermonema sp.]
MLNKFKYLLLVLFLGTLHLTHAQFAPSSVLAQGEWWKIGIMQRGLYKITYNELKEAGLPVDALDPRSLRLYAHGSGMLPQANSAPRPGDLQEVAIRVAGEEDGKFDPGDYILFYGEAPSRLYYDDQAGELRYEQHLYDKYNYYFLTHSQGNGKRITETAGSSSNAQTLTTYDYFLHYEKDAQNILKNEFSAGSGREWYGEMFFVTRTYSWDFELPDLSSDLQLRIVAAGTATTASALDITANGQAIGKLALPPVSGSKYDFKAKQDTGNYVVPRSLITNDKLQLSLSYPNNAFKAYLNYIELRGKRLARLYAADDTLFFTNLQTLNSGNYRFVIEGAQSDAKVWDISNPFEVKQMAAVRQNAQLSFFFSGGAPRFFVAWQGSPFLTAANIEAIEKQNLHALPTPQLLIVAYPDFLPAAEKLAEHHRQHDGMSVAVVSIRQVYHEFSGGKQDPTALRDFVRMLYERSPNTLHYLLLMGDASYDYRHLLENTRSQSLVPTYESRQSLHPVYSFSSDDYFGFLESNEGEWKENFLFTPADEHTLDIGIGRIPCNSLQEAQNVVDKIIAYATENRFLGDWRQQFVLVGDDGDNNQHQRDADQLAAYLESNHPAYIAHRLLLDAFEQQSTPSGEISPAARQELYSLLQRGSLLLNYSGHGSEFGWTQEGILTYNDIRDRWNWQNHYPFMVTATCEFGRYDDPSLQSAAEEAILRAGGGAIGLLTTTRPVYASTNFLLNQKLYEALFTPVDGELPRLGDLMRITKNNSLAGVVNRNFSLLGDPALRLAYPRYQINLTRINGMDYATATQNEVLSALEEVHMEGSITDDNGQPLAFDGELSIRFFDKATSLQTKGSQGNPPMTYYSYDNLLFQGKASVVNGQFSFRFVLPKGIQYYEGYGKLSLYAADTLRNIDAGGGTAGLRVGGTASTYPEDNMPPRIDLYMNDSTFRNGDMVPASSVVYARFYDEHGINLTGSSRGQGIVLILDDSLTFRAGNYYFADRDDYTRGTLRYPLSDLPPGEHSLRLLAWDTYMNPAEANIRFVISDSQSVHIHTVETYPNPFGSSLSWMVAHDVAGEAVNAQIELINNMGQKAATLTAYHPHAPQRWRIESGNLSNLPNGLYIYRLILRAPKGEAVYSGKIIKNE